MMNEAEKSTLALKVAEAILLFKGQISLEDIRAMPFLDDTHSAELIANHLKTKFKTTSCIINERNLNDWEELIILNLQPES
jgi:hypothetical protein